MRKLLKLKQWISLPEAAQYLSTVLEEPVSIRDLYAIALDGNLKLTIALPRSLLANPIFVFNNRDERDAAIEKGLERLNVERVGSNACFGESTLHEGFFDLAMLGGEIEFLRYMAFTPTDEPYDSMSFDETILRDEKGMLLGPLTYLRVDGRPVEEVPWYGNFPDDVQIIVRVTEIERLVRSITPSADGSEAQFISETPAVAPNQATTAGSHVAPYLDPNHPRYAYKLAAAVRAWLALDGSENKPPIPTISVWLESRASELGLVNRKDGSVNRTGIEECAKVANWRPLGGATKTPDRRS